MNVIVKLADFTWQKIFIIALALSAGYYFFMFDDGSSLDQALNVARAELKKEQEMLAKTEKAMKDLDRFKEELNSQQAQVREVMSFLPNQMNVSELVSTIQDRANQAGMRVTKSEPKDETKKVEFYESMPLQVELQGTYSQVAAFLSLLSKLPRLVTIDKIALRLDPKSPPDNPKLAFAATIIGYRFVPEEKKDGAQPTAGGAGAQ
ncbi:MAG: type 4a pilus biogenesis protein PilO [Bdellovibrionaceae bacterium]|nr:type 4a pilus biogenesis protein PilO [Pseudobdellovibrionaceae bacterium]